ncbi:MAG: hypothetical protein NT141_02645 [candidate division WWE3 bacterium]|nr:hypothetical protein [candidate division WWE3 bacterium]
MKARHQLLTLAGLFLVTVSLTYFSYRHFNEPATIYSGNVMGATVKNADPSLPLELKLPSDAKILSVTKSKQGSQVTLETKDNSTKITGDLQTSLINFGWLEVSLLQFNKSSESLSFKLTASLDQTSTVILVNYTSSL